ncbi:MAG: hypothetical protein II563_06885 [Treponema sp.]|nr:hypothetical protein [Treponema sp.]
MEDLLELLKDGRSRSIEMIADELNTTKEDVLRRMEFLEHTGMIRRLSNTGKCRSKEKCSSCGSNKKCVSCIPEDGFKNMGEIWEVI